MFGEEGFGVTEAQLDEIEAAVGFVLPPEYRRVAVAPPFRPIGRDWVYWFYDDPAAVIGETLDPLADGDYDWAGWQAGYLTIGQSAAGDPYVLDTAAPGLPVHCLSHETHLIDPEYPTFAAFVEDWLSAPERVAANLAAEGADERRRMRLGLLILVVCLLAPLAGLFALWLAG